jgi:cytochrome c-type biogenesis protein CcmH
VSTASAPARAEASASGPLAWLGAALLVAAIALAAAAALRWPVPLVAPSARSADAADAAPAGSGREALVRFLQDNPRNGRGWVLLGLDDLEAERWVEAAASFEKAVQVSPRVAADPAVWCWWADALGMSQGRSLVGRPAELIERALALRADHPMALEMAGSLAYEQREFARAAALWRQLLPQFPRETQQHQQLAAAIARAERLAATALPPPPPR